MSVHDFQTLLESLLGLVLLIFLVGFILRDLFKNPNGFGHAVLGFFGIAVVCLLIRVEGDTHIMGHAVAYIAPSSNSGRVADLYTTSSATNRKSWRHVHE